jgi:flagellar biosynthesis protein FliR
MNPLLVESLVAEPVVAAGVLARVGVASLVGLAAVFPTATLRIRATLAILLAVVALPLAAAHRGSAPLPAWPLLVAGEAVVGLGFGLAVAIVLAAASWAGGILGSVAGLSWADDFDPEGDAQAAGMARLCRWLALGGFLGAGGHLAVVAGLIDGVRTLPIGAVTPGDDTFTAGIAAAVTSLPDAALALAVSLALPAITAVLVFHLASTVCLRTIRFVPGQGMLQAVAALVLLAAVALGAETWCGGFGVVARARVEGIGADDAGIRPVPRTRNNG